VSIEYPYQPKSTSYIEQGQYWSLPLDGGGFGCGVVIAKVANHGNIDSREFLAGLLDWFGESEPTIGQIENTSILEKGYAHIKTITETGGLILGPGVNVLNMPEIVESSDSISTWGYNFICALANKYSTVNKALKNRTAAT